MLQSTTINNEFVFVELDVLIKSFMHKDENNLWHCTQCGFSSNRSSSTKNHIESKHIESPGFMCSECDTVCPTRNALTMHIGRKEA